MFDTHYDLLTIAYNSYIKNDYSYLEKVSKYFRDNNVRGVIANLYFMSREEMNEELGPNYYQDSISVYDMFVKAKEVLDVFLPDTEILYSIEGADYIKDTQELEDLYEAGLDSLILCWNTESKYGSGIRSNKGLTASGRELVERAIELGIGIDLSHANINTFNDLVDLIKEKQDEGYDVVSYASHSNVRSLCDRERNLYDWQIDRLNEIDALIGIFSNKGFIVDPSIGEENINNRKMYVYHIDYASRIVGFDRLVVATDDMEFCADADPVYGTRKIYNYDSISKDLGHDLICCFGEYNAYKMLYSNSHEKIYNKIRENREKKRGKVYDRHKINKR